MSPSRVASFCVAAVVVVTAFTACSSGSSASTDPADGDDGGANPGVPPGMTAVSCTNGGFSFTKGITPATPVDFVGYRVETTKPRFEDGGFVAVWSATLGQDVSGTVCKSAADVPACEAAFAQFRQIGNECDGVPIVLQEAPSKAAAPKQEGDCSLGYLVVTRGTDFQRIDSIDKLRELLGTIDTPEEALLLARESGEILSCAPATPTSYRALEGGGFEVRAPQGTRCGGVTDGYRTVRVGSDGTVVLIDEDAQAAATRGCQ